MNNTNTCLICGEEIPEGRQVCWGCEADIKEFERVNIDG